MAYHIAGYRLSIESFLRSSRPVSICPCLPAASKAGYSRFVLLASISMTHVFSIARAAAASVAGMPVRVLNLVVVLVVIGVITEAP